MRQVVGFSLRIRRAWLDAVLDRMSRTTDETELRQLLEQELQSELRGKEVRAKTAGIILRTWCQVSPARRSLRDRAIAMLPRISGQERLWLHWGMAAIAYPFFRDTAEVVGRLLALQDDFTTAQVRNRIITTWGDRATSRNAAQYLLNTLVEWEVLRATKVKGQFLLARKQVTATSELQLWLLEALLEASSADELEAQQLLRLPECFPFSITVGLSELRRHEGFHIHRQGLDMDMVAPRKVRIATPALPPKPSRGGKAVQGRLFPTEPEPAGDPPAPVAKPDRGRRSKTGPAVSPRPVFVPHAAAPLAGATTACLAMFRRRDYQGSLALAYALGEALIRHVWQIRLGKPAGHTGDFPKWLAALQRKQVLTASQVNRLGNLWQRRFTYQHLRPKESPDRELLAALSYEALEALGELQQHLLGFSQYPEGLVPTFPKYWERWG
jgi:hypothetical protein